MKGVFLTILALAVCADLSLANAGSSGGVTGLEFSMYLSRAGELTEAAVTEVRLTTSKVHVLCGADFKRGFSIRCEPPHDASQETKELMMMTTTKKKKQWRVKFFVNSIVSKIETKAPYFLKGVAGTRIRPFFFGSRKWVRVTCRADGLTDTWVLLQKSCDSRDLD